ncbi:alpha/beta hydrolase fold-domain-containing protein [Phycomyces nitens]|nr:alpha/beta hydrolase fold-domain-containing protein [Phycomyces nitens]
MSTAETLKMCQLQGCCTPPHQALSDLEPKETLEYEVSLTSPVVLRELYNSIFDIPLVSAQIIKKLWARFSHEPRRPTWDIKTTIMASFMQVLAEHSMKNSVAFWRIMVTPPSFLIPLTCNIEDGTFRVKRRKLRGILKDADDSEDGTRLIDAEWIQTGSILDIWTNSRFAKSLQDPATMVVLPAHTKGEPRPRSTEKIILYLHGGGYCTMSVQTHRGFIHKFSQVTGRRVLAINYRLAPEVLFPGALYDTVQAFLNLIDPIFGENFDPSNILLAGDSAGGGLCLATLLYLRDHHLPMPEGAVLVSPWVDLTFSYSTSLGKPLFDYIPIPPKNDKQLNPALHYLGIEQYKHMTKHPYVSPLFADSFENLPPLLFQSGGCEALRDEIRAIVEKIKASKTTSVHYEEYEDMVHVFQAFPLQKAQEAMDNIGWWVKVGLSLLAQRKELS